VVRYRFSDFTLSPQRRVLVRDGREVPLIPRYFDLLLLLIERRGQAVHRREIFDRVWSDAVVSDSALSQAVRTIRRTLDDDPREPRFIRTVSRHGYRFVFPDVIEEEEDGGRPADSHSTAPRPTAELAAVVAAPQRDDVHESRWRRAARVAARRWAGASAGGALAGIATGVAGGLVLAAAPGSPVPVAVVPVLTAIAAVAGAAAGAGVGAGVAFAEAAAPSPRVLALTIAGALGGGLVGAVVQWLTRSGLSALVGLDLAIGGGPEGVIIGACAGAGFAIATRAEHGWSSPRGSSHLRPVLVTALTCGLAGLALTWAGRPLAGGTIHAIANAAEGSQATLAPLGRLLGEPDFGPVSGAVLGFVEGAMFGVGLAWGLMRPPRA
jgi:DNA-binding winged helix-turn-helix (wHTH) protein